MPQLLVSRFEVKVRNSIKLHDKKVFSTFIEISILYPGTKVKINRLSSMDHLTKYIILINVIYFYSGQQVRNTALKDFFQTKTKKAIDVYFYTVNIGLFMEERPNYVRTNLEYTYVDS